MIADKIKLLREQRGLTQSELVVELSMFFNVSTDFLLDMPKTASISVEGLNDKEISILTDLIEVMKSKRNL